MKRIFHNDYNPDDEKLPGRRVSVRAAGAASDFDPEAYYPDLRVGLADKADIAYLADNADNLKSTIYVNDSVPYLFRTSGGAADIGNREYDEIVGGTLAWNQLVDTDTESVTIQSGHKYYSNINGTESISTSDGTAISVTGGTDNVIDLTIMFGSTIADYVYGLEQSNEGAGVAWFRKLFPDDNYEYNAGELLSVSGVSAHEMVGFNAYNDGEAKVLGGNAYQITGTYTGIAMGETSIVPDVDGIFTPAINGTLTITGGGDDTCVHLVWSGYRNGEYEPYVKHTYPLDSSLTLRGIPKLDASNNLYYDGDVYAPDGTVTRKYGIVDLGTLTWTKEQNHFYSNIISDSVKPSGGAVPNIICLKYLAYAYSTVVSEAYDGAIGLSTTPRIYIYDSAYTDAAAFTAAMSGVYLVYELATTTTETATPYSEEQIVDDFGTEEYVSTSVVPVGHNTRYLANLRDKLQNAPDSPASDGDYIMRRSSGENSYVPLSQVRELPDAPTTDGTYTLKVTVTGGVAAVSWED